MTDINFQPVFDYLDDNGKKLKEGIFTEVRSEMAEVKTSIANLSAQVKKYHEKIKLLNNGGLAYERR